MEIINIILSVVILLLSIPIGFLIAHLTREELRQGRKWFLMIILICLIGLIITLFMSIYYLTLTFAFIIILTWISYWKSFDKKWVR